MFDEPEAPQRGHHPDSPSSLQASAACPKFENEQRNSPAAAEGTLQHVAAETGDMSVLDGDPEMIDAVSRCLAYENRAREALRDRFPGEPVEELSEQYLSVGDDEVWADYLPGLLAGRKVPWFGITGGYADRVLRCSWKAVVLDWKFGRIPVTPAKQNLQGIAYVLGVFQRYPAVVEIDIHFFAPYQGFSEHEQYARNVATFYREQIPALELSLRTVIARKHDPAAEPVPHDDLCIWCAEKGRCKALHALVFAGASKYSTFTVPEVVDPLSLSTSEQVERAFIFASQIETIAKAVKKRAVDMVLREEVKLSDRLKLTKRVERQLVSLRALFSVARRHGLRGAEVFSLLTAAITKVEEKIKAKAPKGEGAAAVRAFQQGLRDAGAVADSSPIFFLQEAKAPAEKAKPVLELNV